MDNYLFGTIVNLRIRILRFCWMPVLFLIGCNPLASLICVVKKGFILLLMHKDLQNNNPYHSVYFFLMSKSNIYRTPKKTLGRPTSIQGVNKRDPQGGTRKTRKPTTPYLHPNQVKKSTNDVGLLAMYIFVQDQ